MERSSKSEKQTRLLVVTDAGQDCDDELGLIMIFGLIKSGDVSPNLTIVVNLFPAPDRARLVRGLADTMLLVNERYLPERAREMVIVGTGSDGGDKEGKHHNKFLESGKLFVSKEPVLTTGAEAFMKTYKDAEKNGAEASITVLCISSLTDVAKFASENIDLFTKYTREVVMMGGALIEEVPITMATGVTTSTTALESPRKKASLAKQTPVKTVSSKRSIGGVSSVTVATTKKLVPDKDAHNNLFDWEASLQLFEICQTRKVPMMIFSRHATAAVPLTPKFMDSLGNTGCPIAIRLRNTQKHDLDLLWRRSIGTTPEVRQGLPERCNRAWYLKTFCGGENVEVDDEAIWKSVIKLTISDLAATVAAIPKYRKMFFSPVRVVVNGTIHQLIGISPEERGVSDPSGYLEFVTKMLLSTCAGDENEIDVQEEGTRRSRPFSIRAYLQSQEQKPILKATASQ